MNDIAKIADGLSEGAVATLLEGMGCDTHAELLEAGLWEPEFPPDKYPDLKQEYFLTTDLGKAVRQHLMEQS